MKEEDNLVFSYRDNKFIEKQPIVQTCWDFLGIYEKIDINSLNEQKLLLYLGGLELAINNLENSKNSIENSLKDTMESIEKILKNVEGPVYDEEIRNFLLESKEPITFLT